MLLRESLVDLTTTPYFNQDLNDYAFGIIEVIDHLLSNYSSIKSPISSAICNIIWTTSKYFRGSISTEIPYEVEYALNVALKDWLSDNCVITTALLDDKFAYHFYPIDAWKEIQLLLPNFGYNNFNGLLIQIALPRIYKHKPLYYVPLYHELGHFIDNHFGITKTTLIVNPHKVNIYICFF